ncbi:unnamed protein product [Polarella glacialis]|uniref:Uncharacterized protein n=1 Tax=Polarella glacialis TaxID=89957 RepID=A0A813F0N8_POLGL|nr:unnamed protein product [Polarella glacialis]
MLLVLLDSIMTFWPFSTWDSKVFLVVDEGSVGNAELCASIPHAHVECIFIPVVEFATRSSNICFDRVLADEQLRSVGREPEWIALFDSDIVLHTYHIPELMFVDGKPVWHGTRRWSFPLSPISLGMDWIAEFTDSFPFVVHADHLQGVRGFFETQMEEETYEGAFRQFLKVLNVNMRVSARHRQYGTAQNSQESCSEIGILGTYLYYFHTESYTWSIEQGAWNGIAPEHSCLVLRVGTHLHDAKHGVRNHCAWGDGGYTGEFHGENASGFIGDGCEQKFNGSEAEGYVRLANSIITRGLRKSDMETLLLSPDNNEEHVWKPESAVHCPNRNLDATLQAYLNFPPG